MNVFYYILCIIPFGPTGRSTSQSLDIYNNNSMGRDMPIMILLRNESASAFQEEKFQIPKGISSRETGSPGRQDNYDGNGCAKSSGHNKFNDFNQKITKEGMSETIENENWEDRKETK